MSISTAIESLRTFPQQAQDLFVICKENNLLDTPIRAGAWTVRQVFHHLPDSHMNSYIRIKLALTEDVPTVKPYPEALWAELSDVQTVSIEVSLSLLEGIHIRSVAILDAIQSDPEALKREFYHPEIDKHLTIEIYAQSYANHGTSHLNGIKKLLDSLEITHS